MSLGLVTSLRNSRADLITAAIDAGTGPGNIRFYTGPRPATGVAITTQTLLAELVFSDPSFGAASAGAITANAVTSDSSANNPGEVVWFRVTDSDENFVLDGSVGLSGADINYDNLIIVGGAIVALTSWNITEGNP